MPLVSIGTMKKFYTLLSVCFVASLIALPFGIDSSKGYDLPPQIENFKYHFGDKSYGRIYYNGTKDISGFETELQLSVSPKGKVYSALLILGPAGIDNINCIARYKQVVKMLNKKYGSYTYVREIKDPIVDDLVTDTICDPVRIEAYEIITTWKLKNMTIVARLIGDDEGFYVEIDYIFSSKKNPPELLKLL